MTLILAEIQNSHLSLPPIQEYETKELLSWGIEKMNISLYWSKGIKGTGIKIAIMDSGVNFNHPDLSTNIQNGYNAINNKELPIDDYGHGTMMTGIIGAKHNGIGIKGIAPDSKIYPVKVLDEFGEGRFIHIQKGIEWCIDNDIDIINMSFAFPTDHPDLKSSIKKALDAGIIIVASVSNSYDGKSGFPASYDGVIAVTSVDSSYQKGETASLDDIDFAAPGVDVITTSNDLKYQYVSGTSIATPHVTGMIALLLQDASFNKSNLYEQLKATSLDIGEKGYDSKFGWGFIKIK
ncbi:S8 family peptidase [Paenibacillus amylolyticus]|uniref:S8 family peptidase n=1 Tax=Paenibacillus amylolyticus TaxID=1451 RepID=UPI003EB923A5